MKLGFVSIDGKFTTEGPVPADQAHAEYRALKHAQGNGAARIELHYLYRPEKRQTFDRPAFAAQLATKPEKPKKPIRSR